jgi:hypothetical protein
MSKSPDDDKLDSEWTAKGLHKFLNRTGYGFQHAVIHRAKWLWEKHTSQWSFECAEFPVLLGGKPTHIDFILRNKTYPGTYLVAECKRVQPVFGRWSFARAPYTVRNDSPNIIFEQFRVTSSTLAADPFVRPAYERPYHLAEELKGDSASEPEPGSGRGDIDDAVAQVLRGVSGLVNHKFRHHAWVANSSLDANSSVDADTMRFIPAVFTTADVWVTDVDLATADLATGNLPPENVRATKKDWIWFNPNRSPNLRHELPWNDIGNDLSKEMECEFTRSIAIVNAVEGMDKFLNSDLLA